MFWENAGGNRLADSMLNTYYGLAQKATSNEYAYAELRDLHPICE